MPKPPVKFTVIVGNVGQVYEGESFGDARERFQYYRNLSLSGQGRCAGEEVTLMESADGYSDIIDECIPYQYEH